MPLNRFPVLFARQATLIVMLLLGSDLAWGETSPVGLWRTIDDVTGKTMSVVRIVDKDGVLSGRIESIFEHEPHWDGRCVKCRDHRKNQPIVGMMILSNLRKVGDDYAGGEILDPENGKIYGCILRVVEEGRRLEVRGFIGISLFGRTQVWVREK